MLGGRDYVSKPFLSAYVDVNYAMCPYTRRCISGFLILLFNNLISWLSKKQGIVTLSTTAAEFVALALCIQECLYIQQLAAELRHTSDQTISVHEDNQSAISFLDIKMRGNTCEVMVVFELWLTAFIFIFNGGDRGGTAKTEAQRPPSTVCLSDGSKKRVKMVKNVHVTYKKKQVVIKCFYTNGIARTLDVHFHRLHGSSRDSARKKCTTSCSKAT
ncbi:hypothetical protein H257_05587 [Aphanomyces astaci]|uniref:Uncharacterized protein n=1 Tax=Aphanomyces astaci TaxID=112090 RepID=W4GQW0_APHAT|nr:hypothetical protein H257_05587 [Aphanomyces astaci]ETV82072.1 hypothetical protein H257_05587 [Aphanomyces astaci]|eukprot:XP_009828809.1 hypothetical protein H257_05587 [Aphanomyces astaci]